MEPTPHDQTAPEGGAPALIGGALQAVPTRVRAVVEPIVRGHGLDLLGVEVAHEGHRTILWVYIDHADGVTIDDCARVSPEISAALDVDDPVVEAYELRVSSPGLDRPLMSAADFRRFAGREVQLQLSTPLGGRRRFTGEILDADDTAVGIRCADGEHRVPLLSIQRARLRYEVKVGKPAPDERRRQD